MRKIKNILVIVLCSGIALFHFIPIYILIVVSMKKVGDLSSRWLPPNYLYLDNYLNALKDGKILKAFNNSLLVTVFAIILVLILGSAAAYPFARMRNRLSKWLVNIVLGVMMIPALSVIVPLYSIMLRIKGINSYWGIILVLATYNLPMSIFLFTNFIKSISHEQDEAAFLDGCGSFQTFYLIIMPQLQPVVASVLILCGIKIWNDYKYALYFLQKQKFETITLYISKFFSDFSSNMNIAAAAATLAILPVCIMFLFLQKFFISGLSEGSIK